MFERCLYKSEKLILIWVVIIFSPVHLYKYYICFLCVSGVKPQTPFA